MLLLHAAGGIIVALTVKYSDNIAKTAPDAAITNMCSPTLTPSPSPPLIITLALP